MLSSRLKAFVIPTSQSRPSGIVSQGLWTIWTPVPVDRTIVAAPICVASFAAGGQRANVVDEAGEEQEARTDEDADRAASSTVSGPSEDGEPHARGECGVDSDAADERRGGRPPAALVGRLLEVVRVARAKKRPHAR